MASVMSVSYHPHCNQRPSCVTASPTTSLACERHHRAFQWGHSPPGPPMVQSLWVSLLYSIFSLACPLLWAFWAYHCLPKPFWHSTSFTVGHYVSLHVSMVSWGLCQGLTSCVSGEYFYIDKLSLLWFVIRPFLIQHCLDSIPQYSLSSCLCSPALIAPSGYSLFPPL